MEAAPAEGDRDDSSYKPGMQGYESSTEEEQADDDAASSKGEGSELSPLDEKEGDENAEADDGGEDPVREGDASDLDPVDPPSLDAPVKSASRRFRFNGFRG
jgi:hypothetical protein